MDVEIKEIDNRSGKTVVNRGKTKAKKSIAKDAIRKPQSDSSIGGNWVVVADTVNFEFTINL
uniref:Movement protein 1 n=1 Tax=Angelonia flower break virus TaxID=352882 RepID=A0A8F8N1W6_9TOMB|nr:movement protein 1 [Angelonia flower break virus]